MDSLLLAPALKFTELLTITEVTGKPPNKPDTCLLYTSDAADERSSVDLGGRRILKKKKNDNYTSQCIRKENQ